MPGHYIIRKSDAVQPYRFVLRADNNQIILTSENYASRQGAMAGIASCQVNGALDVRYQRKQSTAAQPYTFVLKAANGEIIGRSENYATESGRESGIRSVKTNSTAAEIRDQA